MNVFKLLSRSSKASQATTAQKLPSSGAVANPQLFGRNALEHQDADLGKSRKRKRGQDKEEQSTALPAELDFFGGASKPANSGAKSDGKKKRRTEKDAAHQNGSLGKEAEGEAQYLSTEEDLPEDERKRILRSHKLKIVVLEDFEPKELEPTEKKKKKRKKEKKEKKKVEKAQKREKTQLYPRPLADFTQLRTRYGISRRLAENIKEQGYKLPTEVQLGSLPLLLGKKRNGDHASRNGQESVDEEMGDIDLLTVAPTGSGKTIAFLIPIINFLLAGENNSAESVVGPRAVVLAPTKELASQIVNEARKLSRGTGVKATLMRKGVEVIARPEDNEAVDEESAAGSDEESESEPDSEAEDNIGRKIKRKLRRADVAKAAILVATPLALLNALKNKRGETLPLPSIRHLVLDEADVLLDPLFREQTLAIWNTCTNPRLRVGLWSATMGSNIDNLTIQTINERWESLASATPNLPSRAPLIRLVVGLKDTAIPNITHKLIYAATEQGKLLGLRQLLHPTATPSAETTPSLLPPFLIFTQTIPRAIALHSELLYDIPPEAGGSSRIAVLHADLSSSAREAIMTRFRRGEVWVLITTDLLARGVDFRGLNGVVNYDVPNSAAAYVHRVGRTGRAGREGGVAVTLYTKEDVPYIKNVANVIRASETLRGNPGEASIKDWMIDALPTPSKREKQTLKKRGVEARRSVKDAKGKVVGRISTKSGYERRVENNRRGAKTGAKGSNARADIGGAELESGGESDFAGFDA